MIVAAEKELVVELVPGVKLISKIDAQADRISDGRRVSLEHKTCGDLKSVLPTLQQDTQLLTEHLIEFLSGGERAEGVLYNMMRKVKRTARAKPPFFGRETVWHNTEELRSHWKHVLQTARMIQDATRRLDAGEDHHDVVPPNPTSTCSWDCAFRQICPMFDDGSDPEPAISDLYVERNPLERYTTIR